MDNKSVEQKNMQVGTKMPAEYAVFYNECVKRYGMFEKDIYNDFEKYKFMIDDSIRYQNSNIQKNTFHDRCALLGMDVHITESHYQKYRFLWESVLPIKESSFNRAQLQESLNSLFQAAIKYNPHDELIFRNNAYIINHVINHVSPESLNNMNASPYDRFETFQGRPDSPINIPLQKQLFASDELMSVKQVKRTKPYYRGFTYDIHREIERDVWIQKFQWESGHFLTEMIPTILIGNIYNIDVDNSIDNIHLKKPYLKWIKDHVTHHYEDWSPVMIHSYIKSRIECEPLEIKNNVYNIKSMPLYDDPYETIVKPTPVLARHSPSGKHVSWEDDLYLSPDSESDDRDVVDGVAGRWEWPKFRDGTLDKDAMGPVFVPDKYEDSADMARAEEHDEVMKTARKLYLDASTTAINNVQPGQHPVQPGKPTLPLLKVDNLPPPQWGVDKIEV